jgi:hypothetical protein
MAAPFVLSYIHPSLPFPKINLPPYDATGNP